MAPHETVEFSDFDRQLARLMHDTDLPPIERLRITHAAGRCLDDLGDAAAAEFVVLRVAEFRLAGEVG